MLASLFRADAGEDRSPWGDWWFEPVGGRSLAGVRVTPDSAMRLTAVYRAVSLVGGAMACLPFVLYRDKEGGGKDRITDHWLYRLLAKRPNRQQNAFEWRLMMQGHLALRGNGYNEIFANSRGEVEELKPLHPDRVTIDLLQSGEYRYKYTDLNGQQRVIPRANVFHLRGLSSDGIIGYNPIELARDAVGSGLAAQEYGARFFKNDARPLGGWIEMQPGQKFKDKSAKDEFRSSWQEGQAGGNRGKTAILEGGMKFHEIGISNKDAQFLETKQFTVSDIARLFGVQPHLIGDLSKSTNNNIEQQALEFVMYTMTYWAELWEHAIEQVFIDDDEGLECEFDLANLLRGDMKTRGEFYTSGINAGWLTRNEARISDGRNPLPGLDQPLEPLNMAPAGAKRDPETGKPAAPEDEPAGEEPDARARALTLAIAGRVVRKETVAVRKAYERHLGGSNEEAWRKWLAGFYGPHVEYVADSMVCAAEIAAAWCDRQLDELLAATDQELASKEGVILPLLESWEASAAAELAARVQTSAQGAKT